MPLLTQTERYRMIETGFGGAVLDHCQDPCLGSEGKATGECLDCVDDYCGTEIETCRNHTCE